MMLFNCLENSHNQGLGMWLSGLSDRKRPCLSTMQTRLGGGIWELQYLGGGGRRTIRSSWLLSTSEDMWAWER